MRGTAVMPWLRAGLLLAVVLACLLPQPTNGQGLKLNNKARFGASSVQTASMETTWRRNLASAKALQQHIAPAAASYKAQGKLKDAPRFSGLLNATAWVFSVNKAPNNLHRYEHNVTTTHSVDVSGLSAINHTATTYLIKISMFKQKENIVQSAEDCAVQCSLVPMCGGWSYCGVSNGCGTDCMSSRKLDYDCPFAKYGTEPYRDKYCVEKAWLPSAHVCTPSGHKLPIESDDWTNSQVPPYSGPVSEGVCTGNAWPLHTCRLFNSDDVPRPPIPPIVMKGSEKEGWISSVVQKPSQCPANITGYECDVCLRSTDPKRCLACSEHVRQNCQARRWYWSALTLQEAEEKWLWSGTCLPCTCPKTKAAADKCYNATKDVGGVWGDDSWYMVLKDAAKQCGH